MNPCGSSDIPQDLQKVFDIMNSVDPAVLPKGFNVPKGMPKGGGKPGDKGDPNPPKKTDAAPSQKTDPSKTNDPPRTTDPAPPQTTDLLKTNDPPKTTDPASPQTTDPPKTNDPPKTTDKPQSSTTKACSRQKRAPGGNNSKSPHRILERASRVSRATLTNAPHHR